MSSCSQRAGRCSASVATSCRSFPAVAVVLAVLALVSFGSPAPAAAAAATDVTLLFPPDRSLIPGEKVELIGLALNPKRDVVGVRVRDSATDMTVDKRTRIFRGTISLEKGINLIGIDDAVYSILSWPKIASDELCLTIRTVAGGGEVTMECYDKVFPHGPFLFDCKSCHDLSVKPDYSGVVRKADLCFKCHDRFDRDSEGKEVKYLHGPVGYGDCLVCHDPHVAKSKYVLKARGNDLCIKCHDNKTRNLQGKPFRYRHSPVEEGKCTSCHNPHSSNNEHQAVRPGNDLCTDCHKEYHQFHRKAVPESALTKIPSWFPRAPDGTMRCFGCHDAHGSDEEHMFIKKGTDFCKVCHKM